MSSPGSVVLRAGPASSGHQSLGSCDPACEAVPAVARQFVPCVDGSRREASAVVQTWSHAAAASRCFSGGFQSAFIVPTYSAVVPSDISVSSLPSFLLEEFPEHNFCIC